MKVSIYVASENLQPKRQDRWSGFIIKADGSDREVVKATMTTSTANQATIATIIEALDRFTRPAEITVYIDSDFVLGTVQRYKRKDDRIMNDLELWQENGWKTARGTEVKNKDDWQRLYNKLRVFEQSSGTFAFEELGAAGQMKNRILSAIATEKAREE